MLEKTALNCDDINSCHFQGPITKELQESIESSASITAVTRDGLSTKDIYTLGFRRIIQMHKSLILLSQECPDNVFFNSRKSNLEGWILPHGSSCMFNTLGKNCSINTEITKYGCLKDVSFFAYRFRALYTQEHKINKHYQICCYHKPCSKSQAIPEFHS